MKKSRQNKYGLPRDIPAPIQRQVRQRCGFGCVVCGSMIYEYHHTDPPFSEAREHCAEKIVLLCGICHSRATRGLLSIETIVRAAANPKCCQTGFSFFTLDVDQDSFSILIGNNSFVGNPTIIRAFGKPLLAVAPPEELGAPLRISAEFYNKLGQRIAAIAENEWRGMISNWDISTSGGDVTIRQARGDIGLQLQLEPPRSLIVTRLNMLYRGFRIVCDEGESASIYYPDGRLWFRMDGAVFCNNEGAISFG